MLNQPTEILMLSLYGTAMQLAMVYDAARGILPAVVVTYATAQISQLVESDADTLIESDDKDVQES
mgnify:CR=1 FL=1